MARFPGATQFPVRWWGFPTVRAPRRIKPTILLVVHITGNSRLPSALGEAQYSNRDGSGASFTFVTDRDGSIVQCLDPETETPWTNGDINRPNTSIPTVKAMVGSRYSPNEFCFATCENVGYEPNGHPITDKQKATLARLVAWASEKSGLPINRNTVIGHKDINSVTRSNCPTSGDIDKFLAGIIADAKAIVAGGSIAEEDPAVIQDLKDQIALLKHRIAFVREQRDHLEKELADAEAMIAELEPLAAENPKLHAIIGRLRSRVTDIKAKVAALAADVSDD